MMFRPHCWLRLFVPLLAATTALAQQVELRSDSGPAYVGEPFVVNVVIQDFKDYEPPSFPAIPDCDVRDAGITSDQTYTSIINGRVTQSRTLSLAFELTPQKPGALEIPPVAVQVDGRVERTRPLRVQVLKSDVDDLFAVEVSSSRKRVYVGQRVPLTLSLWVKPAYAGTQKISARDMFSLIDFNRSELGPFPTGQRFNIDERRWQTADGTAARYYVFELSTDWVADRPGPLSFESIRVVMHYPTQFSRDFFDNLQVARYRTLSARPKVAAVEVLSPPLDGRPAGFTGAVGTFDLAVSATPTQLRVGDPIELTIDIRGDGPLDTLQPPPLASDPRLTNDFIVPGEELAGVTLNGRRRFTQTIRARRADVEEIPPIEYVYFDPHGGEYAVARSRAIPLDVSAAETLDAADLSIATTDGERESSAPDAFEGLLGNVVAEDELLETTRPVTTTEVVAVTVLPPALFGALAGFMLVRRRDPGGARRRRATALARAGQRIGLARTLPSRECAREVSAAMAGYLADRLDQPAARFVGRAGAEQLRDSGVSEEFRARWEELTRRCELLSYSGGETGEAESIAREAIECLGALEREPL